MNLVYGYLIGKEAALNDPVKGRKYYSLDFFFVVYFAF